MNDLTSKPQIASNPAAEFAKYDYIFCGMGASSSLLLLNLYQNNLLEGLKILLIDQERKIKKDKTFCFWSHSDEPISKSLKDIISHSWHEVELPNKEIVSLEPYRYNHVSSIDLYNKVNDISNSINCETLFSKVDFVGNDVSGSFLNLDGKKIYGEKIFDSRTPVFQETKKNETYISQSFVGWFIETNEGINQPLAFRFMDFEIEQQGFTQFVYVLPFSNSKALVEVTRFGSEIIEVDEAEALIEKYVLENFGEFKKLDIEQGCIPMSNSKIQSESVSGITNLGARNYKIKSSTGYAFKNMFNHTCELVEAIKKGKETEDLNNSETEAFNNRFAFYDGLLLDILDKRPQEGKRIFVQLLEKVGIQKVLKFLDEKTTFKEDVSIFYQLPWKPFIDSLIRKVRFQTFFRPMILLFFVVFLLLLGNDSIAQKISGFSFLVLGMVAIGIPHGAVDHLLETGSWNVKKAPKFIFNYLLFAALMGVVWFLSPTIALLVFLAYSAWHFGQADGKQWNFPALISILWGASLLIFILGTHQTETRDILASMQIGAFPVDLPVWALTPWLIWAFYKKHFSLVLTILWLTLGSFLPLIFTFGLYFIGQHSVNGWSQIKGHLKMTNTKIWLHSLPFHAAAWLFLISYYLIQNYAYENVPTLNWGMLFIFISCISLPHSIAMHFLYIKNNKNQ